MAHDPLPILLRLRKAAEDEAKRAFAVRLAEQEAAQCLVDAAYARMTREREIASDPALGDGAVEAYVAWLPTGRRQVQAAEAAHDRAIENVTIARAALTLAHAAAEAVATLLAQQAEAASELDTRKSQASLDEIAGRSVTPPR